MANEIGLTEVSATSMDIVSSVVQDVLKQKSVLLPTITDYSAFASKGAKQVDVPRRTQFAAADKTENTDLTKQVLTFSVDSIPLTKHKAILASLEDIAQMQSIVDVDSHILMEMAEELALQVDKDILAQLVLASAAAPDHRVATTSAGALAQGDLLEARNLLNKQLVPMTDRFLLVSPDMEKSMLLISDFVRADSYGSPEGLRSGELGRIYGMTVIAHTEVVTDEAIVYHKSHVGYASQMAAKFRSQDDLDAQAVKKSLGMIYGVVVLDSGKRGVLLNNDGL